MTENEKLIGELRAGAAIHDGYAMSSRIEGSRTMHANYAGLARRAADALEQNEKDRKELAPLFRAIVASRDDGEERKACKALAKWVNDDLDSCLWGDAMRAEQAAQPDQPTP